MACPHFKYTNLSKSKGNNLIAKASYISRTKIFDELDNKMKYPHAKTDEHRLTKMLLPDGAPADYSNPERIWNDLNKLETDRFAKNIILPLPNELTYEQNIELAEQYLYANFVSKGHPVQMSVHAGENNHNLHVHALVAERQLINGTWSEHKSATGYYKRGTVITDENGKITNRDTAVILTAQDKVDSPKLKHGKLQYDKNGKIITEKNWQLLQYDKNGNPLLDEAGCPVLVDIREPKYIPGTRQQKMRRNGKYWKPDWQEVKIKTTDIDAVGNISHFRKSWEEHQNLAFRKYGITDENGNIFKIDLRSYQEQNKERPADEQLIPTRHIGYGKKVETIADYNAEVKQYNELVQQVRKASTVLQAKQNRLTQIQTDIKKLQEDNKRFYAALNPRQLFINIWKQEYTKLLNARKQTESNILTKIGQCCVVNDKKRKRIDRETRRGKSELKRLLRHRQLMNNITDNILSVTNTEFDIDILAGRKFDNMSNPEIVSFLRERCGHDTAAIVKNVLGSNIAKSVPFYPKPDTNELLLKKACKYITGKNDISDVKENADKEWNKHPEDAPPQSTINVLNSYYTAENYYKAELTDTKWTAQRLITNYNPEQINRDYNREIKQIEIEEEAERNKWSREKYDLLASVRNNHLAEIRKATIDYMCDFTYIKRLSESAPGDAVPDRNQIEIEVKKRFEKMQANILIKSIESLPIENKDVLIANYKKAAAEAKAYYDLRPADDIAADGQTNSHNESYEARRER